VRLIPPQHAAELMRGGAVVVDIREADEHAAERIPGAAHRPLSGLPEAAPVAEAGQPVVFHCKMGNRTMINADELAPLAPGDAYIIEGGIDAWKDAGLPVERGS
jgi:rhodanese-related sulfurtransferase